MSTFNCLIYTIYIRKAYYKIPKNTFMNYRRNGPRPNLSPLKLPGPNRPQVPLPKRPHKNEEFMVKTKVTKLHLFTNMIVYYGKLACLFFLRHVYS